MLPLARYNLARHEARFHVQIRYDRVHAVPPGPSFVQLNATVVRVFRGEDALKSGDPVTFRMPITWPGDELPCGGVIWKSYFDVEAGQFAEAFLDGEPPNCALALWQIQIVDAPTDSPLMQGKFPVVRARRSVSELIAKFFLDRISL